MMKEKGASANTVIVGASAAGLACASCLQKEGIDYVLLEQHQHVGHAWSNHYDRLHLHTNKALSHLPYLRFPKNYPKYPSRDQVIAYLEDYRHTFHIRPVFGQQVVRISKEDGLWLTETHTHTFQSANVIIATGNTRKPFCPTWEGQKNFQGEILHSSAYKNGRPYKGKHVLVVGFGNSACEIALCLHEHGAHPAMAVRGPVNVLPRDILGIPVLAIGIWQSFLPTRIADALNKPILRWAVGDISKLGLKKAPYGAVYQIRKHQKIPLLDIGTMALIKKGKIKVYPGIKKFSADTIYFDNGEEAAFDAVILGTGYRPAVTDFLKNADVALDRHGLPLKTGEESQISGLYFCGFHVAPTGVLRAIGREAKRISRSVKRKPGSP